jgi:hypothetical protein
MKIIYLNILEGCEEPDRFRRIIDFIKKEQPDIFCISEANHWVDNKCKKIDEFKERTGFRHSHFCRTSLGFDLAFFSNILIKKAEDFTEGFIHGLMKIVLDLNSQELTILLTHLNPVSEDDRLPEIK